MGVQVQNEALKAACPIPFDEGRMWKSEDGELLKLQLQQHFQNMTKAMDCVGCEKCKLWGKLQLLGELLTDSMHGHLIQGPRVNSADLTSACPQETCLQY